MQALVKSRAARRRGRNISKARALVRGSRGTNSLEPATWRTVTEPYRHLLVNEIRLLILAPKDDSGAISFRLKHVDIDDLPPFEALSYAWGTEKCQTTLRGDTVPTTMTVNLLAALRRLQLPSEERLLWVDALCINQSDVQERNQQVGMMRQIYVIAQRVILWLGEEDEYTALSFQTINASAVLYNDRSTKDRVPVIDSTDEKLHSVNSLLGRPYFTRKWVVQEIVLAKEAVAICGSCTTNFENLRRGLLALFLNAPAESYLVRSAGIITEVGHLRSRFLYSVSSGNGQEFGLVNLLSRMRRCHVTDPKDHIFAVLGLSRESRDDERFRADYSQSVRQIFTDFTRLLILKNDDLDIFGQVYNELDESAEGEKDWPSWVPDWRLDFPGAAVHIERDAGAGVLAFQADAVSKPVFRKAADPFKLCLQGIRVDKISVVFDSQSGETGIRDGGRGARSRFITSRQIVQTIEFMNLQGVYLPTKEDYKLAVERTLCADRHPLSKRLSESRKSLAYPAPGDAETGEKKPPLVWATFLIGRAFFQTANDFIGLGPAATRPGDLVCILFGGRVPFILRERDVPREYIILGESYVHGIMDGEACRDDVDQARHEWFVLV